MSISSRIHDTIEAWQKEWGDRLRGWMASWLLKGIENTFEDLETKPREGLFLILDELIASPDTPSSIKPVLEKIRGHQSPAWFITILVMLGGMLAVTVLSQFTPAIGGLRYGAQRAAKLHRLDPMSVITAWRRDPEKYAKLFDDLMDQGWDPDRIEALKFYTEFIPTADEQTLWLAREVYEPEMITKYGLDDELPVYAETDFAKVGVTPDQMANKWRAHWLHASWMQMVEMLHRGLVTEADVYEWFRLVEMVPFWRDKLIETAYTWPTRVDVRRWWDMRTIDETELRRLYSGMGYRGVNLDNYILWTKVYVAFPDLMARWSKGWITLDDVKAQLTALGMPAERLEEFIQMKVKAEQPERTAGERDVTKTDIIRGVKQGVITREEGIELLVDMGYDEDEAVYILEINIPRDEEDVVVEARKLSKTDIRAGLAKEVITEAEARVKLAALRYKPADVELLLQIYQTGARELAKADIVRALKIEAITEAEALSRLVALDYTQSDARLLLTEKVEPPAVERQRQASKADIVLGVKKGLITPEEGYGMLLDLGFTPEAADFILMVKIEESPFSPINYPEFKELTQKYRVASGREARPMPEELKKAAEEVVKLTGEVEALERSITQEERGLVEGEVLPEETTKRLKSLQVKRNRAISELARAKTAYNSQLVEWRRGLP